MSEQLFASISENGINVSTITGASGALGNLYVRGSNYNPEIPVVAREVSYNGSSVLTYSGVDHRNRRGINVAIFNSDMSLDYMATYDVYGEAAPKDTMAAKLNGLLETQIAVLTSYDAISSNENLDNTFKYYRSVQWPGTEYFSKGVYHQRSSYSAIICGKKGAIVAESFVGNDFGVAEIQLAFNNPLNIGYSGYGSPIISDDEIRASAATQEFVYRWHQSVPIADLNLRAGDSFFFKSLGEIDSISAAAGGYLLYVISYLDDAGSWLSEETRIVRSVEGWQEVEIRDIIPDNCKKISIDVRHRRDSPGDLTGTVYAKNTVMQLSDNGVKETSSVSFGVYGTAVKEYEDSLGNFGQYDPDGYFEAYSSESNLLANLPIQQSSTEPVRWMDRILDSNSQRAVLKTTSDLQMASSKVSIDPSKWYYVCVWVDKQYKEDGEFMLGFRSLDNSENLLTLKATNTDYTNRYLYSQTPKHYTLEDRQWYLLQGFIIPHNVSLEKATEFIEANKEFYGWDDIYGNGIGVSDEGSGYYGWVNNSECVKGHLAFLDYYNNGKESKSLWALPIIRELRIASIDIDDGLLTSVNLT